MAHFFCNGGNDLGEGVKEIMDPLMEVNEIRQPLMEGDENKPVSSGQKHNYITIIEIIFVKFVGAMCSLSKINRVFLLP